MVHAFILVFLRKIYSYNAFILMQESPNHATACNKTQKKLTHKEFRLKLAKDLIGTYTTCQTIGRPSHTGCFTDKQFPMDLSSTAACVHCSNKTHNPSLSMVHMAISICVFCVLEHIILVG